MKASKLTTFFVDLLTMLLVYSPAVSAVSLTFLSLELLNVIIPLKIVIGFLLVQIFFCLSIFIIRSFAPKLKAGVYETNFNAGFISWYINSMLTRSAKSFGLHYVLHSTATMRWLYWRSLGANVSYNMNASYKLTIHDAPMITIHPGVTLSENVNISGHLVRGDKILVAPVVINNDVFIGRETYIGPRTRIGKNAWIGMGHTLIGKVIKENEKLESLRS